jgi:MFS family permease
MGTDESIPQNAEQTRAKPRSLWTKDFTFIALINLTTFVGFNMTTTGLPVYVSSLGANDLFAGLVTTFAAGAALFVRPFTGLMLDRFGRKGALIGSIAATVAIIVAYAVFPIIGVILALRLLHGAAWGIGSTAVSTIAADAIPRNRFAEGMGYFGLTFSLAVAVAPALTIALLQNIGVIPVIAVAAGSTAISLILAFFQRSPNVAGIEKINEMKLAYFVDQRALLPAGMMFLVNCASASIMTFIALYGQAKGIDHIFMYFTIYAMVTLLSRSIIGKIIDRTGFFMPGVLSALGVIVTLVIIAFADNIAVLCVAGIFAGLGIGTGMGTFQTMAVSAVSAERRGVATSTFLFGLDAGIAAGAAVAGAVAGAIGYGNMYLAMTAFPAIAFLVFILLGRKRIARYSEH